MTTSRRDRPPPRAPQREQDIDLYALLGVPPSAEPDAIQAAYRRRARELHPDVNRAPDATQRFAALQNAYDILSDPERRRLYDEDLDHDAPPSPTHSGTPAPTSAWDGIGARRSREHRPPGTPDAADPTGFEELYQAFFATRAAKTTPKPRG